MKKIFILPVIFIAVLSFSFQIGGIYRFQNISVIPNIPYYGIRITNNDGFIGTSTEIFLNGNESDGTKYLEFNSFILLNIPGQFFNIYTGISPIILLDMNALNTPNPSNINGPFLSFNPFHLKTGLQLNFNLIDIFAEIVFVSDINFQFIDILTYQAGIGIIF
ncbi:MAG: hypothetical protein H7A31_04580 [Thermotogae bacterium]|nr:hypothetical protein [Thermotogota bacterium]MCP5465954.1 hypothetical protein [Thermotogota bacterium]